MTENRREPSEFSKRVGVVLRQARRSVVPPLSMKAAAAAVGVSQMTMRRVENGDTAPDTDLIGLLATRYGRSVTEIMTAAEDPGVSLRLPE